MTFPDDKTIQEVREAFSQEGCPILWGDKEPDEHDYLVSNLEEEVPRSLTAEELAFLEAYLSCVAVAPREEVIRFLRADSEERSSNEFYDSMSDLYTSICDAKEVWYAAMQFAKGDTK
jgi:hypothetical protein